MLAALPPVWSFALAGAALAAIAWWVAGALRRARAVREELASWRMVEDLLPVALVRADPAGRVTGWNPAATRIFGYRAEEMLGSSVDLLDASEGAGLRASMARAREDGHWIGELSARRRDGGRVRCESVLVGHRAEDGSLLEQIALHQDVTRLYTGEESRRRLEEQLRQSQKMEAVGQLAGGIAHDFNNLLTSILGYAEILGRHFEPDSEHLGDLAELERAGRRAASLTRQLLSFSREQSTRAAAVDVVRVVADLVQLLRPTLGESLELAVRAEVDAAWVLADRTELEQVLVNLALNARDAMPLGGALTVTTEVTRLPLEELAEPRGLAAGEYVVLRVEDEGRGMAEETRARIFEPFFTTKDHGKGTGLGLSTVQGIVERCGGVIRVESALGEGTTFEVWLPRVEPELAVVAPSDAPPLIAGGTTILVVEDEPLVRRLVCSGLREAGYVVLEAQNGAEARRLSAAHSGSIEVLVTDVVMPGEGGVELATHLVATRPDLRVLYISGYTEDAILPHGVPTDGASFLQKPFTSAALQARIHGLLHPEVAPAAQASEGSPS